MAAGDLVVADYQVELRVTLMGDTTNYGISRKKGIAGLGAPPRKDDGDVDLDHADGAYSGGPDSSQKRILLIPIVLEGTPSQVGGWSKTLETVWKADATADIPIYLQLPGYGKFWINGRPAGWDPELQLIDFGIIEGDAMFVANDPLVTYV